MKKNSTLLFILDGKNGENQLVNADEIFDPKGSINREMESFFGKIEYIPSNRIIKNILMHS
ncbi:MAG: hypothetical protein H6538_04660 [Bacteroidales bacterium]|nr:hypothetical protein [Bacteroidales bacterium]MCB9013242.1 hypothetical protein [Bacteroidales bacterium]